jgi:hypothetical protein
MIRTDWEVEEKMPRFDDIHEFDVWIRNQVRRVKRIGNRSTYYTPGVLVYLDCTHPQQEAVCDEEKIQGWRMVQ